MEIIQVECTKGHTYDAVFRNVGDIYPVKRRHLAVLVALKRVRRVAESDVVVRIPLRASVPAVGANTGDSGSSSSVDAKEDAEAIKKALRVEYKAIFGKDAHGRTSIEKLRSEIEAKKGGENG